VNRQIHAGWALFVRKGEHGMNAAMVFMQATTDGAPCCEGICDEVGLEVHQKQFIGAHERKE